MIKAIREIFRLKEFTVILSLSSIFIPAFYYGVTALWLPCMLISVPFFIRRGLQIISNRFESHLTEIMLFKEVSGFLLGVLCLLAAPIIVSGFFYSPAQFVTGHELASIDNNFYQLVIPNGWMEFGYANATLAVKHICVSLLLSLSLIIPIVVVSRKQLVFFHSLNISDIPVAGTSSRVFYVGILDFLFDMLFVSLLIPMGVIGIFWTIAVNNQYALGHSAIVVNVIIFFVMMSLIIFLISLLLSMFSKRYEIKKI